MDIFLLLIQIPILIFLIRYIRKQHSDLLLIHSYYYILAFKVTAGFFVGILYLNYYKVGDTLTYLMDLDLLDQLFHTNRSQYFDLVLFNRGPEEITTPINTFGLSRAFIFIRIMSPLYLLSGSNYWIFSIYLSLFSFSGFWILSNTLIKKYHLNSLAVLISFFIFPTVVLWSSGVLKESLVIGGMCYIISILLNLVHRDGSITIFKGIVAVIFSALLLYIKFYYFGILFAILIPYGLVRWFSFNVTLLQKKQNRIISFVTLFIIFSIGASFLHPLLNLNQLASTLYHNYEATLLLSGESNAVFYFPGLNEEAISFLPNLPKALSYGLFGPFLWQCKKIVSLVTGVENTLLLILFTTFILANFKKDKISKIDIEEISIVFYVAILAIFMSIASPNWGTLVRYKVAYLPFFLLLILNKNPFIAQLEARIGFLKRADKKV